MAWTVPTYTEIRDRMLADCDELFATDGYERGVVEYVVISAVAGAVLLLYVSLAVVSRDNVPSRASALVMRLWAAFFGVIPKPATKHVGTATFAAGSGAGPITAGTSVRLRNGIEFLVDSDASENAGFITVSLTAAAYGPGGRSLAGKPIFLGSPVGDVASEGITGEIAGGQAKETDASVLARLLDRLRDPPKGGTSADFVRWVKATPGVDVSHVWVTNSSDDDSYGPSAVKTLFTVVPTAINSWDPIPTTIEVGLVQAYVAPFVPVDVLTYTAKAATGQPLDLDIGYAPCPDSGITNAITANLRAMLVARESPGGTILLSQINEAISDAPGITDQDLTSPVANVSGSTAESVITLGNITFGRIEP